MIIWHSSHKRVKRVGVMWEKGVNRSRAEGQRAAPSQDSE